MKVATKLVLMLVAMMAFILCVGGVGLYVAKVNYNSLATVYRDRVDCLEQLNSISDAYAIKIVENANKPFSGAADWMRARSNVARARQIIRMKWNAYLGTYLDPREKRLVDEAKPFMARADSAIDRLEVILKKEDAPALQTLAIRDLYPAIDQLTTKITALIDIQVLISKENLDNSEFYYKRGKLISLLLIIVGSFALGLSSFLIVRGLLRDLGGEPKYVRSIALAVAAGDLSVPVKVDANKHGSVLWAMGIMVSQLRNLMSEKEIKNQELKALTAALEIKIAERAAELRQKDELLLIQNRHAAMGEMIGNIAHQWRQPLNNLGLIIQELKYTCEMSECKKECIDNGVIKAMEVISHMSITIDDFRNFFKPDVEKCLFKISDVISKSLHIIENSLQDKKILIAINTISDSVINNFQTQFAQAVINILNNACDVLVERDIAEPKIWVTISTEGNKSIVTISDNAGGVPEEIIGKVFDPYFTTKGPQQGTGIGLFMAKSIIEKNMGGRLTVLNNAYGAEFKIEV